MTAAFTVEVDGNDISGFVKPETVRIERAWGARTGYAEFEVGRQGATATYYSNPSTLPGVLGWWHMDEASGNLADASGNGRTLTVNGTPVYRRNTLVKGYGGRSIRFDGATDYFSSTAAALKPSGDFSHGMWIRLPRGEVIAGEWRILMSTRGGGFSQGWKTFIYNPGSYFLSMEIVAAGGGSSDILGVQLPAGISDGRAHHIVVTYTSATKTFRVYVDGELAGSDTTSVTYGAPGGNFQIGADNLLSVNWFKGRMQEAFLSSSVLTADEVADLYKQGATVTKITKLRQLSEVIIRAEDGTARFGGYAASVDPTSDGAFDAGQKATIVGWETRFDSIRVSNRWYNLRTDEIIADIFGADARLSSYDLSKVRRGRQLDLYQVADKKLTDVLDQLATYDLNTWYVSADGTKLVYQPVSLTKTRRWYITDDPDIIAADSMAHAADSFDPHTDMLSPLSRVIVKGGASLTDLNPQNMDYLGMRYGGYGDAALAFTLGYDIVPRAGEDEIIVEINDGTGASPVWSSLDVGRFDRDTLKMNGGDKDVLWAPKTRTFFFDASARPQVIYGSSGGVTTSWRFRAQRKTSVVVVVNDAKAEERLGGIYEDVITDETLVTTADAKARARLEIRERAKERLGVRTMVSFEIDGNSNHTPLQVGDLLHMINTKRGIDTRDNGDGLQVQRIITTPRGGGGQSSQHEIFAGYWPKDVLDYQYQQLRRIERIVVDDYFDAEETVNFLDFGYDGDPGESEGVIKIQEPTWAFS